MQTSKATATTVTEAGYVGDDVENILVRLLAAADYDVKKAERGIIYIDDDVDYGQNATVTVVLPDNAQGTVTVNVNGDSCTVPISGSATLKYNNLVAGDYTVSVIYSGDDNFNGNSASSSFKVNKIDFVPGVSVSDIYYGQNASVVVSFNGDVSVDCRVGESVAFGVDSNFLGDSLFQRWFCRERGIYRCVS